MKTFRFDSLVRDKVVADLEKRGARVSWRTLTTHEFEIEVAKKLEDKLDELDEEAGKDRHRDTQALAEVAEVYEEAFKVLDQDDYYDELDSAMEELENGIDMWEITPEELLAAKNELIERDGSYKARKYVETISLPANSPLLKDFLNSPDKYPEVK